MTHHDDASTYADLLARLGDEGTEELFRRLLEYALQDLIDAELNKYRAVPARNVRAGRAAAVRSKRRKRKRFPG